MTLQALVFIVWQFPGEVALLFLEEKGIGLELPLDNYNEQTLKGHLEVVPKVTK
jgi:hypothetical protein